MTTKHEIVESPTERTSRDLLVGSGSAPGSESELTIEIIWEPVQSYSALLDLILYQTLQPRRRGINE